MGPRSARWQPPVAVGLLLLAGLPARAVELLPLAVRAGRCDCVLPDAHPDDKFFLILGSLARTPGPHRVTVRTESTADPAGTPLQASAPPPGWKARVEELAARQAEGRRRRRPADPALPSELPPRDKTFHLFTGGHDFQDPTNYTAVQARLAAVGRHCQVYVDRDHSDPALVATVADALRTFDEEVWPRARQDLGHALDVDGDGRFTILFTPWLGRLQGGKTSVGGFVRGSDFYRDMRPPFGNRCDMMFLNADLRPGPHLRTILAHEYTHAVVFSEHVFGDYLPGAGRADEESWLNEGLAHLAEDAHGFGWSNLDYRVSAFLNSPERYRLLVADYYGTGLWRSPGVRGLTYLFLRWCADRHGAELSGRLVRSNLQGVENLEVATGERFEALFRHWSADLLLSGTGLEDQAVTPLRRVNPRRPLGGRMLCGPRFGELALSGGSHEVSLAGTAIHYLQLHSPGAGRSRLTVHAPVTADLQVTLVRLPRSYPRLTVRVEPEANGAAFRLRVTAHGGPVTVEQVAWEQTSLRGDSEETSFRPLADPAQAVRSWLGDGRLAAAETRISLPVPVPPSYRAGREYVVRLAAVDDVGRRLAAWADLRTPAAATP